MNEKGKVVVVVQARMGSSRLPGKVMKNICNKPVLELMLERLSKSKLIDEIVVDTTNLKDDDLIFEWLKKSGYSSFRGSELDCLDRHYQVGKKFDAKFIAKITSDCPLIDPEIVDNVIGFFLEHSFAREIADLEFRDLKSRDLGISVSSFLASFCERPLTNFSSNGSEIVREFWDLDFSTMIQFPRMTRNS